jgi:hypothetical protein
MTDKVLTPETEEALSDPDGTSSDHVPKREGV